MSIRMRSLVMAGMVAFVVGSSARAALIDRTEASVNSSLVLLSDVRHFRATEKLRRQLDPLFAETPVASKGAKASTDEIVNFLIDERLIQQAFPVTDAEVENQISQIQANNRIDRTQLRTALSEQGFTFEEYFELIRASTAKRNLIDRDIRTKVTISDQDVRNYFFNHYARSSAATASYRLRIITVSPKNYKTAAAAKDVANRAATDLKSGEPFEEVAKRISDSPTASSGGDLGTVAAEQLSPAVREQVQKLKVGETSPVFGTPQAGYTIVKLEDIRTADTERLEKMKDEIRAQLTAAEYQHQIGLWLDRHRADAFIHRSGKPVASNAPQKSP